jgi:hypothetical protein
LIDLLDGRRGLQPDFNSYVKAADDEWVRRPRETTSRRIRHEQRPWGPEREYTSVGRGAPDLREFIRRALTPARQTFFSYLTGDEVLVVTDANGGDSSEVQKAQRIEQVGEAAAAVEELDPRDRKTPLKT